MSTQRDISIPIGPDTALQATPTGDVRTVTGTEALRQSLIRRATATPGTTTHRPTYGAGLEAAVGRPATLAEQSAMANRLRASFLRDARVRDCTVSVSQDEDLRIIVEAQVQTRTAERSLALSFSVGG